MSAALFKRTLIFCVLCCVIIVLPPTGQAQSISSQQQLLNIKAQSDSLNRNFAAEKIHLQFDKPYYALGDTIWFKAWLVNAPSLLLSAKSGLLHVEIATDSNKIVQQFLLPVSNGVTWGNIALTDKEYKAGAYVIRAYTNWMRNFGDETFYYKRFNITTTYEDAWLVNSNVKQSVLNAKPNVQAILQFKNLDNTPVVGKPVSLRVMSGKKTLYKQVIDTDLFGSMDINFAPPQKTPGLYIIAESGTKDKRSVIPLNLNNPANIDLQFMPEGGSLIDGLTTRVGFKAVNEDGHGADIKGVVTDSKGNQLAALKSTHNGMGSFTLKQTKAGEVYSAKLILPDGSAKTYPLPGVKPSGLSLAIDNDIASDSVKLTIRASEDVLKVRSNYFLIAKARNVICYAAVVNFKGKHQAQRIITKNLFPTGITRFVLTTEKGLPLSERMVFINRDDNLNIKVNAFAQTSPKDSVTFDLAVTDNTGNPVQGNFAIGVTDDGIIKQDTLKTDNILTNLLLTSDLKGLVEDAGYYLQKNNTTWQHLDNLLLTQGWVNYEISDKGITYKPEADYEVSGKVINVFNKPVTKAKITMMSLKPVIALDTVTNTKGQFKFRLPLLDTPAFIIKAARPSGKTINASITANEFKLPVFFAPTTPIQMPWYVNAGDTVAVYVKNNVAIQRLKDKLPDSVRSLNEVVIKAKKVVKGSNNINGSGNADLVFDEQDMEKAGKKSMLQFLEENVKGFRETEFIFPKHLPPSIQERVLAFERRLTGLEFDTPNNWFYIGLRPAVIKIDGVEFRDMNPTTKPDEIRDFLKSRSAEEIKGIEVNATSTYNTKYMLRWHDMPMEEPFYHEYAFIEITTRSGQGPATSATVGVYLYKPLPLSLPKQFYKPKYNVTDAPVVTESRSTINWEPNITTDADGHATVKFNAASKPSTYTIITQGIDYNGNIGYKQQKMSVGKTIGSIK